MSHRLIAALIAAVPTLASAAPVLDGPPRALTDPRSVESQQVEGAHPAPIADLFYVRGSLGGAWAPGGRDVVISTNLTGRFNLWKVPGDGGFPLQLTQSDDRQSGIAVSPKGDVVVFDSDHAGDEIYDLYVTPLAGGATVDLTNTPDVSETGAVFANDGRTLAFDRRVKSEPSTNVAVMDMATRQVRVLTHESTPDHQWSVAAITRDGHSLLANRSNFNRTESAVYLIDIASGAARALTPPAGSFTQATDIDRQGKLIAVTTELPDGRRQAGLLDVASGHIQPLRSSPWEQDAGHFSPDGARLAFATNEDGRVALAEFEVAGGAVRPLSRQDGVDAEPSDRSSGFSPDGTRFLFVHTSGTTPTDFWVEDLASGQAGPITRLGLASIDPARLPPARIVHYGSADGTVISALMWTPFGLARDGHAPAVVLPHGGPTGQTLDTFNRTAVALASRGYVVIAPNPRGSTGYGRAFQEANHKDLGGGDLLDEVAGVKFMEATGYVDPARVGITGGSYGGYMTLMATAKTPKLWRAAVEEYGIIDWFHMYQTEAPTLQQYQIGLIGDPVKDKAVYEASSPLTYIHQLTAPLLVLQGDNDIRVPRTQALELIDLLKKDGRTVDSHFYANEGHGFVKRENQIDALERTVAWFDKYLKAQ